MSDWPLSAAETLGAVVTVGALLCGGAYWVSAVNADRSTFKTTLNSFMEEIRTDIKGILSRLPPAPVVSSSPLQLTDFGKRIAEHFGAQEWADSLAPDLLNRVRGFEPFQVDEFCYSYIRSDATEELKPKIAKSAYEFGIKTEGVQSVLQVVLRDALFRLIESG